MCGIVGYAGKRRAQPILFDCLGRLEYRGYDSCGIAVKNRADLHISKDAIRVADLQAKSPAFEGTLGIGHTRWATHGEPSKRNSHPHLDCTSAIALVHNGIVTNAARLASQLSREGHSFVSETDTEVLPHLIEKHYQGNLEKAVAVSLKEIEGSYAIAVVSAQEDGLVVARKDSPLVIGVGDGEVFVASDVPAILNYTNRVVYLEDMDVAVITRDGFRISRDGKERCAQEHRVLWSVDDTQKSGYEHFMLKEISEQPRVMRDTIAEGKSYRDLLSSQTVSSPSDLKDLMIVACGTSYHAGLIGKYLMEDLHQIPVRVEVASEFNHCRKTIPPSASIVISQSGETADVLSAMKRLREAAVRILVITNVPGSTASRIADDTVYTKAGPEISVAATKSFIAQLVALYQIALFFPGINEAIRESLVFELRMIPNKVESILANTEAIQECARFLSGYENVFFIGRGINVPVALEGALKMKEISYIHAEGYAAGELKHRSLALLSPSVPVIAIATRDRTYDAMMSNMIQAKARHAPVIVLTDEDNKDIEALFDHVIRAPYASEIFAPILNAVVLQLLAYYTAKYRGCPIDFPRNLAKSVTVE